MSNVTGWRGLAFPFHFDKGKPAVSNAIIEINDFKHIDESIRQILGTRFGERPFSPIIGLGGQLVFRNYSPELLPYYETIIKDAVVAGEKRVEVSKVKGDISTVKTTGSVVFSIYWTLLKYNVPHITESSIAVGGGNE